ncbi:MAG: YcgL domain-containing protein [Gammaproteobacteria bacterium]|nr:MAG: YcgL domain-containing protein [Gammaproteobacteria bacterium]
MYLYLATEGDFDSVPDDLLSAFGPPHLVMQLTLSSQRPLAREDVFTVMRNLREQGFHLQMPPKLEPTLYHGNEDGT